MKKQKKGLGGLYALIACCLLVSGLAVFGMLNRVDDYQDSAEAYNELQRQALVVVDETTAAPATSTPQPQATASSVPEQEELEGEEVEDDALYWMLTQAHTPTAEPVPTASPTLAPTATPTASPTPAPSVSITEAPIQAPTQAPTESPTPEPTAELLPSFVPQEGISMERAVTVSDVRYSVDFNYLYSINEEIVGWLYQEETPLNYPILRGTDNEYYLKHMPDRSLDPAGSVFMDYGNSAAFIDAATYLYAHNRQDGGMFASLSEYTDQAYYDAHPSLWLMTPFADYQVDLFAGLSTTVEDETSWRVKEFDSQHSFDEFISSLRESSFFQSNAEAAPEWGDKLLVLVTCTNVRHGQRYVIYGRMRPVVYENTETVETTKYELDNRATQNGYLTVGPLGEKMVYAQNDELWADLLFESRGSQRWRKFGAGGCGPTAVAMAIANLVEPEELPKLIGYASAATGYTFCTCSVNQYYCSHRHAQYQLRTSEEFLRYFPLAVASFTTGNNIWGTISRSTTGTGTDMRYLDDLCNLYGIRVTATKDVAEALEALKADNTIVISCTAGYGSPFTSSGHYVVLAGVDAEYVYVLDPFRRDSYSEDRRDYIEILTPGVVRIKLTNADHCNFSPLYILEKVQ